MRRKLLLTLLLGGIAAIAMVGTACSDGSDDESSATATATEMAMADEHDEGGELAEAEVAQSLSVEMKEFAFEPASFDATAGEVIEISFTNSGAVPHDFTIEHADMDWMMVGEMEMVAGHTGDEHAAGLAMHVPLDGGHDATARMRVHEPGEYVFYCTVPGHRDLGMEGTLTVK